MSAHEPNQIDHVTGTETTGHEWDGIRELNTPLPKWWLYTFYACIVFSLGYWVVYPTWPGISSYTGGLWGWSSRGSVADEVAALHASHKAQADKIAASDLAAIKNDPDLLAFASAEGAALFKDNCAPCHGAGGGGAPGYPNLNDDDWLWGGKLEDIQTTLTHGIRSPNDEDTRVMDMTAFGRDAVLTPDQIIVAARYVRSLAGLEVPADFDKAAGAALFTEQCAACHGPEGKGMREMGAPNLTDAIWLYGSDEATIINRINVGGGGMMPNWNAKFSEGSIKSLAVYVHGLGGGE